jgi:hypothetical protein
MLQCNDIGKRGKGLEKVEEVWMPGGSSRVDQEGKRDASILAVATRV